jgi:hypothetical protein
MHHWPISPSTNREVTAGYAHPDLVSGRASQSLGKASVNNLKIAATWLQLAQPAYGK